MNNKLLNKIKVSKSLKNVMKIVSGTMAGQAISFITLPIITRIYGAQIMGIWAIITAVSAVVNAISDMGLSKSIMIEDENYLLDTYTVVSTLSFFSSFFVGFIFFIYFCIFPNKDGLSALFMGMTIGIYSWLAKQVDICYTLLNREQKYKVLMRNPVVNQIAIFVVSCGLGILGFIKYGYYMGTISGTLFTIINMKSNLPFKIFTFKIDKYKRVFRVHKHFVIYQTPADLFGQIKNTLPSFLLKKIFGSTAVGYYSISLKLLNAPVNLLGMSVGRVFYSELGKLKREEKEIKYFIEKNVNRAFRTAMLIFLVIFAFGDIIAVKFLGEDWYIAGEIMRIMCFMSLFTFVSLSTQGICIIIEKQKYTVAYSVCQIIAGIIAFLAIGLLFDNLLLSLAAYTISVVVIQIVYFCFIYNAVNLSILKYLKNVTLDLAVIVMGTIILRFIAMQFTIVNTIFL